MRRDYKYLYQAAPMPFTMPTAGYTDPVETDEERRRAASRLAKQRAELRRAKLAERWVVFTAAAMLTIMMLPVLAVVGTFVLARVLWRRYVRGGERPQTPAAAHGIHMPSDQKTATPHPRHGRQVNPGRIASRLPLPPRHAGAWVS